MIGTTSATSGPFHAVVLEGIAWHVLSRRLAWGSGSIRQPQFVVPRTWCIIAFVGMACCLVHLLVGLWGARDCRRRSIAISDPDLLALVEELRITLGIRTGFEVRELPGVVRSSAAAVGWWRPMVLLPGDWRSWNESERRAVLAHEASHIRGVIMPRESLVASRRHALLSPARPLDGAAASIAARAGCGCRRSSSCRWAASLSARSSRLAVGMGTCRLAWPASAFLPKKDN